MLSCRVLAQLRGTGWLKCAAAQLMNPAALLQHRPSATARIAIGLGRKHCVACSNITRDRNFKANQIRIDYGWGRGGRAPPGAFCQRCHDTRVDWCQWVSGALLKTSQRPSFKLTNIHVCNESHAKPRTAPSEDLCTISIAKCWIVQSKEAKMLAPISLKGLRMHRSAGAPAQQFSRCARHVRRCQPAAAVDAKEASMREYLEGQAGLKVMLYAPCNNFQVGTY